MKTRYFATQLSLQECRNRLNNPDFERALNDSSTEKHFIHLKNDVVTVITKRTDYFSYGLYRHAYRKMICRLREMENNVQLEVSFAFQKRHIIICAFTMLLYIIAIGSSFPKTVQTARDLIPLLAITGFFCLFWLGVLWLSVLLHKNVEKKLERKLLLWLEGREQEKL